MPGVVIIPTPMIDIFDPDGLVRSQAVEDPLGLFRVTLNGADSHRTLAGSFLAETSGASMQHIALATTDIFSSLKHMFELGFEALPISENYYEDLIARFDLPKEFVDKMQKHNVLLIVMKGGTFCNVIPKCLQEECFLKWCSGKKAIMALVAQTRHFEYQLKNGWLEKRWFEVS